MVEAVVHKRIKRYYWKIVRHKFERIKRRKKLDLVARDYSSHQIRVRAFKEWKRYTRDVSK